MFAARLRLPALLALLLACFASRPAFARQTPGQIEIPAGSSAPVVHAAEALATDMGWVPSSAVVTSGGGEVQVVVDPSLVAGAQDFELKGTGTPPLLVRAKTEEGAVNGVHGLRLRLMSAGVTSAPGSFPVAATVAPSLARRGMMVAPYNFGGQQDMAGLGTDTWSLEEWKDYVDFLRLLNANVLEVFPIRMHTPARPETWMEEARYAIWKDVLNYCHQVGMEFHLVLLLNQAPGDALWDHPALEVQDNEAWSKTCVNIHASGAPAQLAAWQQHTYNEFKDADAFVYMWNDGGAADYSPTTLSNPVGTITTLLNFAQARLNQAGSSARTIFWGWLMEPWYPIFIPGQIPNYPALGSFYTDALSTLPTTMEWLQETDRHYATQGVPATHNPTLEASLAGFQGVTNFFYQMHPEMSEHMLPRPMLQECVDEVQYSLANGCDGLTGYRLSPLSRRLNDFAVLRLCEDASLTRSDLLDELAAYYARGDAALLPTVRGAIDDLDVGRPYFGAPLFAQQYFAHLSLQSLSAPLPAELVDLRDLVTFTMYATYLKDPGTTQAMFDAAYPLLQAHVAQARVLRAFSSQPQFSIEADLELRAFLDRLP